MTTVAHLALRKAECLACPKVAWWDAKTAENLALKKVACSGAWMVAHLACWRVSCSVELWAEWTVALWEQMKVAC